MTSAPTWSMYAVDLATVLSIMPLSEVGHNCEADVADDDGEAKRIMKQRSRRKRHAALFEHQSPRASLGVPVDVLPARAGDLAPRVSDLPRR